MRIVIGVLAAWFISSCTFFGNEERLGRLEEGRTQQIEIPEGLDRPQFVDLMPIPEIEDPRGLGVRLSCRLQPGLGLGGRLGDHLVDEDLVALDERTRRSRPREKDDASSVPGLVDRGDLGRRIGRCRDGRARPRGSGREQRKRAREEEGEQHP